MGEIFLPLPSPHKNVFKSRSPRWLLCGMALSLSIMGASFVSFNLKQALHGRKLSVEQPLPPYSQPDIAFTAKHFRMFPPRVLLFDGVTNSFSVFSLAHNDVRYAESLKRCGRCGELIPLLVDSLRRQFPNRFVEGGPSFQLMFSEADSPSTECINNPRRCNTARFAPIVAPGSIPKNPDLLPSIKAFPNWFYLRCIYQWHFHDQKTCSWTEGLPSTNVPWSQLTPQIIWRGSDFSFLRQFDQFKHLRAAWELWSPKGGKKVPATTVMTQTMLNMKRLSPRWKAAALSLRARMAKNATLPWIDSRFFGTYSEEGHKAYEEAGASFLAEDRMGTEQMSKYRYQIDLGGGGGTTWRGTLTKLGMPGLLFHHETPTKDWFYDDMKPWVHYVPIDWDLSNLKSRYNWAEANPLEAQKIANAGTAFFAKLTSGEYMEALYDQLFVKYLASAVQAYRPRQSESTTSVIKDYELLGYQVDLLVTCPRSRCDSKSVTKQLVDNRNKFI